MRFIIPIMFLVLGGEVLYFSLRDAYFTSAGTLISVAYGAVAITVGILLAQRANSGTPASRALKIVAWGVVLTFVVAVVLVFMTLSRIH